MYQRSLFLQLFTQLSAVLSDAGVLIEKNLSEKKDEKNNIKNHGGLAGRHSYVRNFYFFGS
jgi:hypothetical protein